MPCRSIRAVACAILMLGSTLAAGAEPSNDCAPPEAEGWKVERAVSLKQLQIDLQRCGTNCPAALAGLHDLGRVDGFVIDRAARDIVVFGPTRQPDQPVQYADSLIVALRVAAHKYDEIKGNTVYTTPAGLTLNPRPQTIAALQRIANAATSRAWVGRFCAACRDMQDLVIFGMPQHPGTSASLPMAQADWTLKKISNSDLPVPVPGFESLAQKRRRKVEEALRQHRPIPGPGFHRLWFTPGLVSYQEAADGTAVALDRADLLIRQQTQLASADGHLHDGGPVEPLIAEWTCQVSRLYREIAERVPESGFDALVRLLRVFAAARLIVDRDAAAMSGLDLGYLLDRHPLTPVPVKSEWPGVAHVEHVEHRESDGRRLTVAVVDLPSCGGVEFGLNRNNLIATADPNDSAADTAHRVIASRPSVSAPAWLVRQ